MMYAHPDSLVSTQWVSDHLNNPRVRIVEVVWGAQPPYGFPVYAAGHIPGAVAWDYETHYGEAQGNVISQSDFEKQVSSSGITPEMTVVLYSCVNNLLATFEFWLMKYYGHEDVRLLDGDREKWLAENRPLEQAIPSYLPTQYRAKEVNESFRATRSDVRQVIGKEGVLLVDASSGEMYCGESHPTTERGGHIPGAINLAAQRELAEDGSFKAWRVPTVRLDGTFRSSQEQKALFEELGITSDKEFITYCLRGGPSTHAWFVLTKLLGYPDVREYDRSWAEWGNLEGMPVETRAAECGYRNNGTIGFGLFEGCIFSDKEGNMAGNIFQQLQALDTAVVTEVVRKDRRDTDLTLLDWGVEPLSHEKIIDTTGGLFRFSGQCSGMQGKQNWSVVLKCINNPKNWGQQPREWAYWKRELLAYQSDLFDHLPPGLRAPRCYGVVENETGAWVWIEHVQECTGKRWSLNNFQRAARWLGQFQGAFLNGIPLPQQPWLSRPFFRSIWAEDDWWFPYMDPASESNAWKSPIVQRAFPEEYQPRVLQFLSERDLFFDANDRLPQVLCHNDAHRRNFMLAISPDNGQEELIAVDWAFFGPGAVGNDLGELAGNSLYFLDYPVDDATALLESILDPYLAGIAENGVKIEPRLVRLGYLIGLTFWMGLQLPGWAALMLAPESGTDTQAMYGARPEEVLAKWVHLNPYLLDRADEARTLIRVLGL